MGKIRSTMIADMKLHGYSEQTINIYTKYAYEYAKFYNKSPLETSLSELKSFFYSLISQGKSPFILHFYYCSLKYLFTMYNKNYMFQSMVPIKRPTKVPIVLSMEEVQILLNQFKSLRNKLIFTIIYFSGLRISEALNLTINDFDLHRNTIHVQGGKGNKDRITILSKKAKCLLQLYLERNKPTTFLFPSKKYPDKRLHNRHIQTIFKRAVIESGISKDAHVHTLRHSFATHLLEKNTNIFYIMKLLGHSSIQSTLIYLHMQSTDSLNIVSPLDSFEGDLTNHRHKNQLELDFGIAS